MSVITSRKMRFTPSKECCIVEAEFITEENEYPEYYYSIDDLVYYPNSTPKRSIDEKVTIAVFKNEGLLVNTENLVKCANTVFRGDTSSLSRQIDPEPIGITQFSKNL